MMSTMFTLRAARWSCGVLGGCLLLGLALSVVHSQPPPNLQPPPVVQVAPVAVPATPPIPRVKLPVEPGAVEVAFTDGSNLKMLLRDERITLATPHGKLLIAVTDIQRIEFATRVSEEDAKSIRTAIADLGNSEFSKREAAGVQLLKLREKAHPALLRAAQSKDLEVVKRAKELIQQITASVPAEQLVVRPKDMVYTTDSRIAGRIEGVLLKAHSSQFGALQVKLADMRGLRSQALEATPPSASSSMYTIPSAPAHLVPSPAPPPAAR
jgi:hypothetical protein